MTRRSGSGFPMPDLGFRNARRWAVKPLGDLPVSLLSVRLGRGAVRPRRGIHTPGRMARTRSVGSETSSSWRRSIGCRLSRSGPHRRAISGATTVGGMKNWESVPAWAWLLVGLVAGAFAGWGITLASIGTPMGPARPALREVIAWQGWVGSVLGAVASIGVALFVLFATLRFERARFEQQRKAEDERFERQRADEEKRFEEQRSADDKRSQAQLEQARDQARRDERRSWRMKQMEVWSDFTTCMREYLRFPLEEERFRDLEHRSTAHLFQWLLFTGPKDDKVGRGVEAVVSDIVGWAKKERRKRVGQALDKGVLIVGPPRGAGRLPDIPSDLVVALVRRGRDLHSEDSSRKQEAIAWFHQRADEKPWVGER